MDLALLVYSISLLGSLGALSVLLVIATTMSLLISFITYCDHYANKPFWLKGINLSLSILIPSIILLVAIPSEKTMYTMVGAYAAQKVAEDPKVQKLSGKVLNILEAKLDGYILDMAVAEDKKGAN